jgi:hypothetical protein
MNFSIKARHVLGASVFWGGNDNGSAQGVLREKKEQYV